VANVVANAVIVAILIISLDLVVHVVVVFFAGSSSSSFESKLCRSSSEWVASFIIVIYTHNERV
jgi:hypothetical protein